MSGVLVTGFEPFGGSEVNPSQLIAEALGGVVLPVSYARAADAFRAAVAERQPDLAVCFGLANDDATISVERFAHNLDEAANVDNEGGASSGAAIEPDGPVAYGSTLPVDEIVAALRAEGIPAAVSRDAGGYLCNHVFYVLRHLGLRGGFVHVPPLEALPLGTQVKAAEIVLAVASTY
jgi:pyroglutamyl-peptidase